MSINGNVLSYYLCLGSRTVFICPTDVQCVVLTKATKPAKQCTQRTLNNNSHKLLSGNFLDQGSDQTTLSLVVKVPGKYVSAKDTTNDVPQMRHIIHIGQGAGDQNVLFTFYGKTVKESEKNVEWIGSSV